MNDLKEKMTKWYISYDPYSDLFQIFDDKVFKLPKTDLFEEHNDNMRFISTKNSGPVLIEVKNAYTEFGKKDIESLSKNAIMDLIIPKVEDYYATKR